jgi:hypothetical protein
MSRRYLVLTFTGIYNGELLASNERSPHVMTWSSLPGRSKHFAPIIWANKRKSLSRQIEMRVSGRVDNHPHHYDPVANVYKMRVDTTIGVQARALTPNEEGRDCIRGCGESLFSIGLAVQESEGDADALAAKRIVMPLVYHTVTDDDGKPLEKGTIVITGVRAFTSSSRRGTTDLRPVTLQLSADKPDEFSYLSVNAQGFNSVIQSVQERSIAMFTEDAKKGGFALEPSSEETRRVHAPTDSLPPGPIPGSNFVMAPNDASVVPRDGTPEKETVRDWLWTLAMCALWRNNMPVKMFIDVVEQQLARTDNVYDQYFTQCCSIVGMMLAVGSTSSPYIGDFIMKGKKKASSMPNISSLESIDAHADSESSSTTHSPTIAGRAHTKNKLDSWQPSRNGYMPHRVALYNLAYRTALVAAKEANESPDDLEKQKIACESFNELCDYASGDCEDLGCFSVRVANTWARTDWSTGTSFKDKLVYAVCCVLRQYVFSLTLGSVRSAALGNEKGALAEKEAGPIDSALDRSQKYGAHMWCLGLSVMKFLALLRRTVPDLDVESLVRPQDGIVVAPWTVALPDLDVEGTGYVTPLLRPVLAYVITGDPATGRSLHDVKQDVLTCAELTNQVYEFLENKRYSRVLGFLTTVKPQHEQTNKPNYRLTKFYRDITHLYNDWLLQRGYSNLDFVAGNVGHRVPLPPATNATRYFEDNPLIGMVRAPGGKDEIPLYATEVASMTIGSSMRERFEQIAQPRLALKARRDANTDRGVFEYGVPLEDFLQTPLPAATALLPGTYMDGYELRTIATLMRHAPPITMPGLFTEQKEMHEARMTAQLADEGVDERKRERDEDRRYGMLEARVKKLARDGVKWPTPTPDGLTLNTFILIAQMLSDDSAVENLLGDITKHHRDRIILHVRTWTEEPLPHQRNIVIQFICDPTALPMQVAPTVIPK